MNKEPNDIKDEEVRHLAIKTYKLRETNSAIIDRLARMGADLEVTLARLEHFMVFLVDSGVITEEMYWFEQNQWEMDLNNQVVNYEIQMREQIAAAQSKAKQQLVTPPTEGKKLLGPNGFPVN